MLGVMLSSQNFDVEDVDFAFDDQPDLHAVLARLRARKPYAVVPFAERLLCCC